MSVSPMIFGGQPFHSRADIMLFIEKEVPTNGYSLFLNGVTLMESMSEYYVEQRDVLQEIYQAVKIGVNEAESRTVASFRLVLPTVFRQVNEGNGTVKYFLPAVKDYQTWNLHDNISGTQ